MICELCGGTCNVNVTIRSLVVRFSESVKRGAKILSDRREGCDERRGHDTERSFRRLRNNKRNREKGGATKNRNKRKRFRCRRQIVRQPYLLYLYLAFTLSVHSLYSTSSFSFLAPNFIVLESRSHIFNSSPSSSSNPSLIEVGPAISSPTIAFKQVIKSD
jgi:hypothetical protein